MNKKFCNNSTLLQNNLDFHLIGWCDGAVQNNLDFHLVGWSDGAG